MEETFGAASLVRLRSIGIFTTVWVRGNKSNPSTNCLVNFTFMVVFKGFIKWYFILFGSKVRLLLCLKRRFERGDWGVGKDGTCELTIDVLQPNHLSYLWGQWFYLFIYFIFSNVWTELNGIMWFSMDPTSPNEVMYLLLL